MYKLKSIESLLERVNYTTKLTKVTGESYSNIYNRSDSATIPIDAIHQNKDTIFTSIIEHNLVAWNNSRNERVMSLVDSQFFEECKPKEDEGADLDSPKKYRLITLGEAKLIPDLILQSHLGRVESSNGASMTFAYLTENTDEVFTKINGNYHKTSTPYLMESKYKLFFTEIEDEVALNDFELACIADLKATTVANLFLNFPAVDHKGRFACIVASNPEDSPSVPQISFDPLAFDPSAGLQIKIKPDNLSSMADRGSIGWKAKVNVPVSIQVDLSRRKLAISSINPDVMDEVNIKLNAAYESLLDRMHRGESGMEQTKRKLDEVEARKSDMKFEVAKSANKYFYENIYKEEPSPWVSTEELRKNISTKDFESQSLLQKMALLIESQYQNDPLGQVATIGLNHPETGKPCVITNKGKMIVTDESNGLNSASDHLKYQGAVTGSWRGDPLGREDHASDATAYALMTLKPDMEKVNALVDELGKPEWDTDRYRKESEGPMEVRLSANLLRLHLKEQRNLLDEVRHKLRVDPNASTQCMKMISDYLEGNPE